MRSKIINREKLKKILLPTEMKHLLVLALPIIGSAVLQMTYSLTDMIWVGRIGSNAVAAIGTAGFFIHLGWALASIITTGSNIKIAHSVGAKDKKASQLYISAGIYATIVLSVAFCIMLFVGRKSFIGFFQFESKEVFDSATSYLAISAIAGLFGFMNQLFMSILNAFGQTKLSFKASLIGTVVNLGLDPILIFGLNMGVDGAAYASLLAKFVAFLIFIKIIKRNKIIDFSKLQFSRTRFLDIVKIGTPSSFQRIMFILIYIVIGRIVAEWGPIAIAVQKIGVQIEAFSYMFVAGLVQAMAITVGQKYGAKRFNEIKNIYIQGLKISLLIGTITSILFITIPDLLFSIFLSETISIEMGKSYLIILGFSQLFMCLEMITAGAFYGLGKTHIPAISSVIFTFMRIPAAYFLGCYTVLSLDGVWWSISGSSIIKGVILFFLFIKMISNFEDKKHGKL